MWLVKDLQFQLPILAIPILIFGIKSLIPKHCFYRYTTSIIVFIGNYDLLVCFPLERIKIHQLARSRRTKSMRHIDKPNGHLHVYIMMNSTFYRSLIAFIFGKSHNRLT